MQTAFEDEGIAVRARTEVASVRRDRPGGPLTVTLGDGGELAGDELLVAAGRRPHRRHRPGGGRPGRRRPGPGRPPAAGRGCRGWLAVRRRGSQRLAPLTHMGKYQGRLAGDAILGREVEDLADHGVVPRGHLHRPAGLRGRADRGRGPAVRRRGPVIRTDTGGVAGAYVQGNGIAGPALIVDQGRRVVVGATFTGPGTQELLHSAIVAVAGQVPLERCGTPCRRSRPSARSGSACWRPTACEARAVVRYGCVGPASG